MIICQSMCPEVTPVQIADEILYPDVTPEGACQSDLWSEFRLLYNSRVAGRMLWVMK